MKGPAVKYDSKLTMNGSFEDILKDMVTPDKPESKKAHKPKEK